MLRAKFWGVFCVIFVLFVASGCSQQATHTESDTSLKKPPSAVKTPTQHPKPPIPKPTAPKVPEARAGMPQLSQHELNLIAARIFQNEGGGDYNNLVHWNDGEDFASMGIGHFTWYPAGRAARFGNTFPDLLAYLHSNGVQLPAWLLQASHMGAPWRTKAELIYAKQTGQVQELQELLDQTRLLQAAYIVERARRAMPQLVNAAPAASRSRVAQNLNAVANTPGGWYALVDYINFKGEGLQYNGGYKGQNWGLLQVLDEMTPSKPGQAALHEFADAAKRVLQRRVRNSPPARNEARWLAGWSNRIDTYRNPGV